MHYITFIILYYRLRVKCCQILFCNIKSELAVSNEASPLLYLFEAPTVVTLDNEMLHVWFHSQLEQINVWWIIVRLPIRSCTVKHVAQKQL